MFKITGLNGEGLKPAIRESRPPRTLGGSCIDLRIEMARNRPFKHEIDY